LFLAQIGRIGEKEKGTGKRQGLAGTWSFEKIPPKKNVLNPRKPPGSGKAGGVNGKSRIQTRVIKRYIGGPLLTRRNKK